MSSPIEKYMDDESEPDKNQDIGRKKTMSVVAKHELKPLFLATCMTHPCGPLCTCGLVFAFVIACVIGLLNPWTMCIEASFSDFRVVGSDVTQNYYIDSLIQDYSYSSLTRRRRRLQTYDSDDYYYRARASMYLEVFYYSKRSGNYYPRGDILTSAKLDLVHNIETSIKAFDGYTDHVVLYYDSGTYYEDPPDSFLNYLYPTVSGDTWTYDGEGDELCCDVKDTAYWLVNSDDAAYDFFDFDFSIYNVSSTWLITYFAFGTIGGDRDELEEWICSYEKLLDKVSYSTVGVAYTDEDGVILEYQVLSAVYEDLELGAVSLIFIFLVVYIYTRSLSITIFGIFGIMMAFFPAVFFFHLVYGDFFNIINFVAIWIILGIGADDIFVFVSSYRRAPLETVTGNLVPLHLRMAFAYREAGAAMLVTSFTTAFSFYSLMFNSISPMPNFGFFIGTLVVFNFIFVMTWFAAVLQIYVWFVQCTMKCGCGNPTCNKYCMAVPVAIPSGDRKVDVPANMKDHFQNASHGVPIANAPRQLSRQVSDRMVGHRSPGAASAAAAERPHQLMRQVTRSLHEGADRRRHVAGGDDGIHATTEFSDCTELYFAAARWYSIPLFIILALILGAFCYTASLITTPTAVTQLLGEGSNLDLITIAASQMDVCTGCISGTSSGTSGSAAASGTSRGTPNPTPAPVPTHAPIPTPEPTTPEPTPASPAPTNPPPTRAPTDRPTDRPTISPTDRPTPLPTLRPTLVPTRTPTAPTKAPTTSPTDAGTPSPTDATATPTAPTKSPTPVTASPSAATPVPTSPTKSPTGVTGAPTGATVPPTPVPTGPTSSPTLGPSPAPSVSPTHAPIMITQPTPAPIVSPTDVPTASPIAGPTAAPSDSPTTAPTMGPTNPTNAPSSAPTGTPSSAPTEAPFSVPTLAPSDAPTKAPVSAPTFPTSAPSFSPTAVPSEAPSARPTPQPTIGDPDILSNITCDASIGYIDEDESISCHIIRKDSLGTITTKDASFRVIVYRTGSSIGRNTYLISSADNYDFTYTLSDCGTVACSNQETRLEGQVYDSDTFGYTALSTDPWYVTWSSMAPTGAPTPSPTYSQPDDTTIYNCSSRYGSHEEVKYNSDITCNARFRNDDVLVSVNATWVALVILGGNLDTAVTGCNTANPFSDDLTYAINNTGVHYCFLAASEWDTDIYTAEFDLSAPSSTPDQHPWYGISLWTYNKATEAWGRIDTNADNLEWYNFTFVSVWSDFRDNELSLDQSATVTLTWGGKKVTGWENTCDGEEGGDATLQFDYNFDIYDTENQQKMLWICHELSELDDAVMYRTTDQTDCLFDDFKEYVMNQGTETWGGEFPIEGRRKFNEAMQNFLDDTSAWQTYVSWDDDCCNNSVFSYENATLRGIRQPCQTQINEDWGGTTMEPYYKKWERFVDRMNSNSSSSLQVRESCYSWILMEVQVAFIDGFVSSVSYTLLLCSLVMLFFTGNFAIMLFVNAYILSVVIWVVGTYGAMGWEFGAIEIISVPTVVGLSIDYALHVTHSYVHSPFGDRLNRAKSSIESVGGSVLGSSLTTITSMTLLYFAQVTIFSDLGWVVASTTTFGIFLALFVCPPLLMYIGPQRDQCHVCWCLKCCGINGAKLCKGNPCNPCPAPHWDDEDIQDYESDDEDQPKKQPETELVAARAAAVVSNIQPAPSVNEYDGAAQIAPMTSLEGGGMPQTQEYNYQAHAQPMHQQPPPQEQQYQQPHTRGQSGSLVQVYRPPPSQRNLNQPAPYAQPSYAPGPSIDFPTVSHAAAPTTMIDNQPAFAAPASPQDDFSAPGSPAAPAEPYIPAAEPYIPPADFAPGGDQGYAPDGVQQQDYAPGGAQQQGYVPGGVQQQGYAAGGDAGYAAGGAPGDAGNYAAAGGYDAGMGGGAPGGNIEIEYVAPEGGANDAPPDMGDEELEQSISMDYLPDGMEVTPQEPAFVIPDAPGAADVLFDDEPGGGDVTPP